MSTPTDSVPASPLFAAAREYLTARPYFAKLPPGEQEERVQYHARRLAIQASEIGRAAARIGAALAALSEAMSEFLDRWPDDAATESAVKEAFAAQGWPKDFGGDSLGYTTSEFATMPGELETWVRVLQVAHERLEECNAQG